MKSKKNSDDLEMALASSESRIAENERQIRHLKEQLAELRMSNNAASNDPTRYGLEHSRQLSSRMTVRSADLRLVRNGSANQSVMDQWWFVVLQGLIGVIGTLGILYFTKNFL